MKYRKLIFLLGLLLAILTCKLQESGTDFLNQETSNNTKSIFVLNQAAYDVIPCVNDFEGTL
jgi:hypothetical protein